MSSCSLWKNMSATQCMPPYSHIVMLEMIKKWQKAVLGQQIVDTLMGRNSVCDCW